MKNDTVNNYIHISIVKLEIDSLRCLKILCLYQWSAEISPHCRRCLRQISLTSWSEHSRTLRKERYIVIRALYYTHMVKTIRWTVIDCLPRNGQIHIYIYNHVALSARIFLTLSCHPSLSPIAFAGSSGLHPVSAQSCCMYVRAERHAFARICEGVHRSTIITRSSLLLQPCPACLVFLIMTVLVMGGRWPYSCCFVGYCLQDLFNIARSILV